MTTAPPLKVDKIESFADHRVMRTQNYGICFTKEYTVFTSEKGTLYVNEEGGTVIMPEENECKATIMNS